MAAGKKKKKKTINNEIDRDSGIKKKKKRLKWNGKAKDKNFVRPERTALHAAYVVLLKQSFGCQMLAFDSRHYISFSLIS